MEIKIYGCELAEALVPYLKKRGVRLTSAVKVGEMSLEFQVQKGKKVDHETRAYLGGR